MTEALSGILVIAFLMLVALAVKLSLRETRNPGTPVEPDLVVTMGEDKLCVYLFDDGWRELQKLSGDKVVKDWELYQWSEENVRAILSEAGVPETQLDALARLIIQLSPSRD